VRGVIEVVRKLLSLMKKLNPKISLYIPPIGGDQVFVNRGK